MAPIAAASFNYLLVAVAAMSLVACATTPQTRALLQSSLPIPTRAELVDVPFYPQRDYQCGPAALAMVINHYHPDTDADELVERVYIPELKGSLQAEMLATARAIGRLAVTLDGRLESVLREVAAGHPVLVLQNLGFDAYPFWHYAVVIGYDLRRQEIVLRSGEIERLVRPFSTFERTWQRADHWAVVATLPGAPAAVTVSEEDLVMAVLALEETVPAETLKQAYRSGLDRWPASFILRMGLGNAYYAMQDYAAAQREFERVTREYPQHAQGWNNLAYARWRLGRIDLARRAVQQAVQLQPGNPAYLDSLREISGAATDVGE